MEFRVYWRNFSGRNFFLATYVHQRGRMCFKSTYDAKVRPLDHSLLVETREMEIFSLYHTYILYYIIYTHNTNVCTFSPMLCKSHRFKFSCSALISHSIIAAKAAADRRCRCHDYCCRAVCFYIIVSLFLCLCVCVCVFNITFLWWQPFFRFFVSNFQSPNYVRTKKKLFTSKSMLFR